MTTPQLGRRWLFALLKETQQADIETSHDPTEPVCTMTLISSKGWKATLALAALLLAAACSSDSNPMLPIQYGDLLFPRQNEQRFVMQALLIGTLVAQDGCLRIDSRASETSYVPIWPPGYELSVANGAIEVVDEAGQARVKVGQEVYMDGGERHTVSDLASLDGTVKQALAGRCAGPYWIVGTETRPATDSD